MATLFEEIPLKVLICDTDGLSAQTLEQALRASNRVLKAESEPSLDAAQSRIRTSKINTVFIDPLSYDLDVASTFVFTIRKQLPEVVFVLYVNTDVVQTRRSEFYRGERNRFSHYYTLDKKTPISTFAEELTAVIRVCRSDLSWRMSKESLQELFDEAGRQLNVTGTLADGTLIEQLRELVSRLTRTASPGPTENKKSVFLSHKFAETEYVSGLSEYLQEKGFSVVTGQAANTYIGRAVLDRIRESEFFLCLVTKHKEMADGTYTTSPWLLQEMGAALAFGKRIVLMVEDGVKELGGLQGDMQRLHFTPKSFLTASSQAVKQLRSYLGEG